MENPYTTERGWELPALIMNDSLHLGFPPKEILIL